MPFTQDFRTQRRNYTDGQTRVGETGRLWYDSDSNTIRVGDGETAGGVIVGGGGGDNYTLPTATTTVKGGVKIDGTTIAIANQVISVGTVPYSSLSGTPTIPTAVSQLTNDSGYLTTVSSLTNGPDTLSLNGANKVDLPGGTAFIFSAANNISLFSDLTNSNYLEIINNVGATISTDRGFEIRTNTDGTDRTWTFTQGGTLFFPDSTAQTTAYSTNAARALFSAANAAASGSGGSLSYSSGVFTFTPALNIAGNAATVTNGVYTTDTSTVTNTMLAGSIANNKLANSSITINSTSVSLGGSITGIVTTGDTGTVTNTMLAGSIANNKLTNSSITVNGTSIALGASGTVAAAAGTLTGTTLASGVTASSLTSLGTLTGLTSTGSVTANNATAFIAGDNAISNVALQMPSEAALRNLTNGFTNMYFDVSIGGSPNGQFQFRSSSSYTNVLTMSPTGVTFNTDATFTSRTPSLARTAFNAAIDTEITVDSMRFRVSNQGGIFPQVIGNGSSRNLAWTAVSAISGSAVNQAGSTGTIVSSSAWTTLYNLHGMDSAGDTVTVTLQDKAAGRIYRITFMRSDNGSTTGYNIIGERIL